MQTKDKRVSGAENWTHLVNGESRARWGGDFPQQRAQEGDAPAGESPPNTSNPDEPAGPLNHWQYNGQIACINTHQAALMTSN